jgi:aminopeptidase YwaD
LFKNRFWHMNYKSGSLRGVVTVIVFLMIIVNPGLAQVSRKVTDKELRNHVKYLSSDRLAGRLTGSEGDSLSAVYIGNELRKCGLKPLMDSGFERYQVTSKVIMGNDNYLSFNGENYKPASDIAPLSFSGNGKLNSEVVFAGYGFNINADTLKWNDYGELNVSGKWVLILRGDPEPDKGISGFIQFSSDRDKALTARDMGASGVLLVSGPVNDPEDKFESLATGDHPLGIPVLRISRTVADNILKNSGTTITEVEKRINTDKKPDSFSTGTVADGASEIIEQKAWTRNVAYLLPGEDPALKDEYVIIGAHFDHLGMGGPGSGSRAVDTIAVHHGADDNASGVSEMMELAEEFALTKGSHKRSMIFASFSGEEEGLLGSKYFADNLPFDPARVNIMINLDMVGRLTDSTSLQISGVGTADGLKADVIPLCDSTRMKVTFSDEGFGPSDHSSFYGKNIPVLFFTTGAHVDYHTPTDTWEKINYQGMKDISDLVFRVAEKFSNTPERLKFKEAGPKIEVSRTIRRRGVTLGIMPDFAGNVKNGLRADFVTPGKPAALGGMKKGDIIISIEGKTVHDIQDYMFRMSQLKHGQRISVEVLRNGSKTVLLIQL